MALTLYVLTSDEADFRTRLANHLGNCPTCGKPRAANEIAIAVHPNPIIATPASGTEGEPGYVPAVMDPRAVLIVQFWGASETEEQNGEPQEEGEGDARTLRVIWDRTRLGKLVKANSTAVTLTGNTAAGPFSLGARRMTGGKHWLLRPEQAAPIFGSFA